MIRCWGLLILANLGEKISCLVDMQRFMHASRGAPTSVRTMGRLRQMKLSIGVKNCMTSPFWATMFFAAVGSTS